MERKVEIEQLIKQHREEIALLQDELAAINCTEKRTLEALLVEILTGEKKYLRSSELYSKIQNYPEGTSVSKSSFLVQLRKMVKKSSRNKIAREVIPNTNKTGRDRYYFGLNSWVFVPKILDDDHPIVEEPKLFEFLQNESKIFPMKEIEREHPDRPLTVRKGIYKSWKQ